MANKVDHIVVGAGLAGACLALQLMQRGRAVALFDLPHENRSSSIAAGLFNPITNKVMNKTWRADELFAALARFYSLAEKITGQKFYYPTPLYRPFVSIEEQNAWMAKSAEPEFEKFIDAIFVENKFGHQVHDPFGGIVLDHCGYVDVNTLLTSVQKINSEKGLYFNEAFDYPSVHIGDEVVYNDLHAQSVVFCEGTGNKNNPFFNWLPVKSLKGETLEIQLAERPELIYNRGVYVVPTQNGRHKIGATYQHNAPAGVTEEGKMELMSKLNVLMRTTYEIASQDWGFRPTIIDRKPVIGAHPSHPKVLIFNGLGTKGVSLAPHFSGVLADWMVGQGQIERDVNITRFYPLYSKF